MTTGRLEERILTDLLLRALESQVGMFTHERTRYAQSMYIVDVEVNEKHEERPRLCGVEERITGPPMATTIVGSMTMRILVGTLRKRFVTG